MAACRFCGADDVVKYGVRKNKSSFKQMFKCNGCSRRFTPDNGFLKMKTEPEIVTEALDLYVKGLSLAKIQDHLYTHHNVKISKEGIRGWVNKYGNGAAPPAKAPEPAAEAAPVATATAETPEAASRSAATS